MVLTSNGPLSGTAGRVVPTGERMHEGTDPAMLGRRLSDPEFLAVLAAPAPPPGWQLDEGGRFLLLPLAERDLALVFGNRDRSGTPVGGARA